MYHYSTLVLNSDYAPISVFPLHTIAAEEAIKRILNGTCYVHSEYDEFIKTPTVKMRWPAIIVRKKYLKKEKITSLNSNSLLYRDKKTCAYCGKTITSEKEASKDHVIPQSKGGKTVWENILLACKPCNNSKGDLPATGKWTPRFKPYIPTYNQLLSLRKNYPMEVPHESWIDFLGDWKAEVTVRGPARKNQNS